MVTEKALFELYQDPNLAHKPKELEARGGAYYSDASLNLVDAIYNNRNSIHVVNVQNHGAISSLPHDAVIECSAVVGSWEQNRLRSENFHQKSVDCYIK